MSEQFDSAEPTLKVLMLPLQITLRVKESEVQCLKQENTSLKAELQLAQRVRA